MTYYFVGIKGAGMSALALVLNDLKENVLGSDVEEYFVTEDNLVENKIEILKFDVENLKAEYIYIIGNAFLNHFETNYIKEKKYKYFVYQDFIAFYFNEKFRRIAVSGTHGKTTTTKMIADLYRGALEPLNALIGDGVGFGDASSKTFLFEACEYKEHFLSFNPDVLVITNIELDHVDYYKSDTEVIKAFQKLAKKSKLVIYNNDCINCRKLSVKEKITFGKSSDSNCRYSIINDKEGFHVRIDFLGKTSFFILPFYGDYMVENFLAAFIVAKLNDFKTETINQAILNFQMPKRRMNEYQIKEDLIFIDDYAHHPKEIYVTLKAVRNKYKSYKIFTIFQPHTFSRFKHFYGEIIEALSISDKFYITDIFSSARKDSALSDFDYEKYYFKEEILNELVKVPDSVIVFMGAGDINNIMKETMKKFS